MFFFLLQQTNVCYNKNVSGDDMNKEELDALSKLIIEQERKRINNAHWADLTVDEISLIEDKQKRKEYRDILRKVHINIVNPLANSVPRKFKFSKPDEFMTYRMIISDYMNYFYNKGMTREQIIEMMIKNKCIKSNRGRRK